MKRKSAALVLSVLMLIFTLSGCSQKSDTGAELFDNVITEKSGNSYIGFNVNYDEASDSDDYLSISESYESYTEGGFSQIEENRKIVYNSTYRIQTEKFEDAVSSLDLLIKKYAAYYESSEVYGTKENADRYGSYKVRVPVSSLENFKAETGKIGVIIRSSENNQDITEKYFDSEARLESAKLREERLLAILETADTLDNILLLESELSDVRYEIESLSGTLRKYDSLVSYSTVNIYIEEVIEPVSLKSVPKTFSEKAVQALENGLDNFVGFWQNTALFLLYNLPAVIILAVIISAILIFIRRKFKRK